MKGIAAPLNVLLCTLLFPVLTYCQDYTWHPRNSLSLGVNYSQIRDENVGNFTFTGPGIGGDLRRRYEGDFFYHLVEVGGYIVAPKTATEKSRQSLIGTAAIKYVFMLKRAFGSDHVSVGLFGTASLKEAFYKNYKQNNLFWANFYGIGAAIAFEKPLSDNYAFEATFEIPLAGAAYRPSITRNTSQKNTIGGIIKSNTSNGNFAMPGNYLNPSLSIGMLTSKPSLLRAVSYKYMHYEVKTAVSKMYWENSHSLTLTFKMGG